MENVENTLVLIDTGEHFGKNQRDQKSRYGYRKYRHCFGLTSVDRLRRMPRRM